MEREYKWAADREQFTNICAALSLDPNTVFPISMDAIYFDTADGMLRDQKIGLRLRRENAETVCCMKRRNAAQNGLHVHEEYECPADTLTEGLSKLVSVGAPAALCETLQGESLIAIAQVSFLRHPILWETEQFCAELSFDQGHLINNAHDLAFCEIECEYKSGDIAMFESACKALAERFALHAEPRSKLARALSL